MSQFHSFFIVVKPTRKCILHMTWFYMSVSILRVNEENRMENCCKWFA